MLIRHRDLRQALRDLGMPGLLIATVMSVTGCGLPTAPDTSADAGQPPEPIVAPAIEEDGAATAGGDAKADGVNAGGGDAGDGAATSGDATDEDGGGKVVEAKPFAGKVKRNRPGLYTTPINAYFSAKQRLAFIQIDNGLKMFKVTNGRKPKNFDEVMEKVIKPAALALPKLEAGDKYIFVPDEGPNGTVMIRKAAKE